MKQPSWSILDRSKPWTPSYATDVAATFRKARERICPKCASGDVERRHHEGDFAAPECDYSMCMTCEHQWGHE